MKESEIIKKLVKTFDYTDKSIIEGPGDDCAVIDLGDKKNFYIFTVDDLVENTHFLMDYLKPSEVASRLVRMNVSDIYSMGDAVPIYCLVSSGINDKKIDNEWLADFIKALKKELDFFGVKNIGGNISKSETVFFTLSLCGKVSKKGITRRCGAKAEDILCCVGNMGDAKAAVETMLSKKRDFFTADEKKLFGSFVKPRIYKDYASCISKYASSMLDNSDGLYRSLEIISEVNSLRVKLDINSLPFVASKSLKRWSVLNHKDFKEYVISGGEDYNLIFTVPEKNINKLKSDIKDVHIIGRLENGYGVDISEYEGKIHYFEHF